MAEVKAQVRLRVDEIERQPHDADDDRDERRDGGPGHAPHRERSPPEDEEGREHDVDDHRGRLHDHARLEVAGAAKRRAHRDHRELQCHRGDEPEEIFLGGDAHPFARALAGGVLMARQHRDREEDDCDAHRQHLRLVEEEDRVVLILPSRGVRHERGGADAKHLRDRDHDERQVAGQPDRSDRVGAEPAHPEQIDQDVERLEDHADQHEARRFEEVARQRTGGEVLHMAV